MSWNRKASPSIRGRRLLIPDVNILVYAYNSDAPFHAESRAWLEEAMSGTERIGYAWAVVLGFLRLMTSRDILVNPLDGEATIGIIRSWLSRRISVIVQPGPAHLEILQSLVVSTGMAGRLTTDLHLAALAIELEATVISNDLDFRRFPGLRLRNPIG